MKSAAKQWHVRTMVSAVQREIQRTVDAEDARAWMEKKPLAVVVERHKVEPANQERVRRFRVDSRYLITRKRSVLRSDNGISLGRAFSLIFRAIFS